MPHLSQRSTSSPSAVCRAWVSLGARAPCTAGWALSLHDTQREQVHSGRAAQCGHPQRPPRVPGDSPRAVWGLWPEAGLLTQCSWKIQSVSWTQGCKVEHLATVAAACITLHGRLGLLLRPRLRMGAGAGAWGGQGGMTAGVDKAVEDW